MGAETILYAFLFIGCTFISSCTQILLKHSAQKGYTGIRVYLNGGTILGYGIMVSMTLVVALLYQHIDLSLGTILDSFGYVFVLILSAFFLKEHVSKAQMKGIALIMLGIMIYCMG